MKYEITARRLREAMQDMNISQQELSEKSHIGKSSISHYVNGTHEPGNKAAFYMANVLNVNPAWLMGLDDNKQVENNNQIPDIMGWDDSPALMLAYQMVKEKEALDFYYKFKEKGIDVTDSYIQNEIITAYLVYKKYESASPQIKAAIDALLKPTE